MDKKKPGRKPGTPTDPIRVPTKLLEELDKIGDRKKLVKEAVSFFLKERAGKHQ